MKAAGPFSRLVRSALVFALAVSLMPNIAQAEEAPNEGSVVEQLVFANIEAINRFSNTGNVNDLVNTDAYNGDLDFALLQSSLPAKYDLRDEGVVTSVKLQNPWGTCWGFGAIAASETSILSELGLTVDDYEIDLSELHLAWFSYMPLPGDAGPQAGEGRHTTSTNPNTILDEGGFSFTATSVISSGIGPVFESSVPYRNKEGYVDFDPQNNPVSYSSNGDWSVDESLRFAQAIELEHSNILPSPAHRDEQGAYSYNEAGTQAIKQELKEGRAVEIAFYSDEGYTNEETWAHYTYGPDAVADHAVTIVGWDDDYSKDNFLAGQQPDEDGAWIIKNSWGAIDNDFPHKTDWGIDGNGYFYLSYHDESLEAPESFDYYVENLGQVFDYYLIDQYDFMPSNGVDSISSAMPASMANVFEAEERQRVRSLSCETARPNTTATYELYLLNEGYTDPKDGELLTTLSETYDYGGYHRVQLADGFTIGQGRHYAVVVTLQNSSGFEIMVDKSVNKEGVDYLNNIAGTDLTYYTVGVVNKGESFHLNNGIWSDWSDTVAELKRQSIVEVGGDYYDYDNFAIKAYADPLPALIVVPDLGNLTEAEAIAALDRLGLKGLAGVAEYSDTIEAGRVIRQDIAAGSEVEEGSAITYVISLGKDPNQAQNGSTTDTVGSKGAEFKPLASAGDEAIPITVSLVAAFICASATIAGVRASKCQTPLKKKH